MFFPRRVVHSQKRSQVGRTTREMETDNDTLLEMDVVVASQQLDKPNNAAICDNSTGVVADREDCTTFQEDQPDALLHECLTREGPAVLTFEQHTIAMQSLHNKWREKWMQHTNRTDNDDEMTECSLLQRELTLFQRQHTVELEQLRQELQTQQDKEVQRLVQEAKLEQIKYLSLQYERETTQAMERAQLELLQQFAQDLSVALVQQSKDLEQQFEADLAQALQDQQAKLHELHLEAIGLAVDGALQELETEHQQTLEEVKADYEHRMQEQRAVLLEGNAIALEGCRQEVQQDHAHSIQEAVSKFSQARNKLIKEHQEEVKQLKTVHQFELCRIEARHEQELDQVLTEAEESRLKEIDDLQYRLEQEHEQKLNHWYLQLSSLFETDKVQPDSGPESIENLILMIQKRMQSQDEDRKSILEQQAFQAESQKKINYLQARLNDATKSYQEECKEYREQIDRLKGNLVLLKAKGNLHAANGEINQAMLHKLNDAQAKLMKAQDELDQLLIANQELNDIAAEYKNQLELAETERLTLRELCKQIETALSERYDDLKAAYDALLEVSIFENKENRESDTAQTSELKARSASVIMPLEECRVLSSSNVSSLKNITRMATDNDPPVIVHTGSVSKVATDRSSEATSSQLKPTSVQPALVYHKEGAPLPTFSRTATFNQPTKTRVMFLRPTNPEMLMLVSSLGAESVEDVAEAHLATHVIVEESMIATPKLMIALCSTRNIVTLDWLIDSKKAGEILDCDQYLVFNGNEVQSKFGFCMKETLENHISARRRGGILAGWSVLVCEGVAGNNPPSETDLKMIVEAAGGRVMYSCPESPEKVLVITSDPPTVRQRSTSYEQSRKGNLVVTITWLFDCVMRQQFNGKK